MEVEYKYLSECKECHKNAVTSKTEKQTDRTITILLSVFGIVLTALIGIFASNLLN